MPGKTMPEVIEQITLEVSDLKTAKDSAIALIKKFAAKVLEFKDAPDQLEALANEMDAASNELGQAVIDNTEAEPAT